MSGRYISEDIHFVREDFVDQGVRSTYYKVLLGEEEVSMGNTLLEAIEHYDDSYITLKDMEE